MPSARTCFSCGYDMGAVPAGHPCPECGRPFTDTRDALDYGAIAGRRRHLLAMIGLTLLVVLFVGSCCVVLSPYI